MSDLGLLLDRPQPGRNVNPAIELEAIPKPRAQIDEHNDAPWSATSSTTKLRAAWLYPIGGQEFLSNLKTWPIYAKNPFFGYCASG